MTLTAETTVDETATLEKLETLIDKRREVAKLREVVNKQHRELNECETTTRTMAQSVEQLEHRLKAQQKQALFGAVKPGELTTIKQQITESKETLARRLPELEEQREAFCLSQEAMTQLLSEIRDLDRQLRNSLTQLYMQRFHEHDAGLYGKRGQVTWQDPDPNSPERYSRQWRGRVFNFLLFKGFASDLTESHLLHALVAFFRKASFSVRVTSGFVPTSTRSKEPLNVGAVISVPKQLSEQEAFEEIVRRRVEFVTES